MQPIYRLGEDAFVVWSTVVDAPVSDVMTHKEALRRFGVDRMLRVEINGHSFKDDGPRSPEQLISANRAGPNEERLTLEAILRHYSPNAGDEPLTPEDIKPEWTNWWLDDGRDEDEQGKVYAWRPWRPGEAPTEMPDPKTYHQMWTRITPTELAELTRQPAGAAS